jgi:hypothetical protein
LLLVHEYLDLPRHAVLKCVFLGSHGQCILFSLAISDSAAPIRNDKDEVAGVVLVFRDITERRRTERALAIALSYADDIIATLREPFVVLNVDLRVKTATLCWPTLLSSLKRP